MDAFPTPEAELQDDIEFASIIVKLRRCERDIAAEDKNRRRDTRHLIVGMLSIAIVTGTFAFVTIPKAERMALIDQELVAWRK